MNTILFRVQNNFIRKINYISILLFICISAFRTFPRPRNVSQNGKKRRQCNFLVSNCCREALLPGWNFTQSGYHPLSGWIRLFQTTPLGGLSRKCWPKLIAKGKGEWHNGTIRQTVSLLPFLRTPLCNFPSHCINLLILLKALLTELTKLSGDLDHRL